MGRYLLIGAGFSRNWGGPLSEEITGSLLGELHDDLEIANALRRGPFEDAFQGFQLPSAARPPDAKLIRFQDAVSSLFSRLNKSFPKNFEFNNELDFSVKSFLAKFGAIFSLNQDLLLEIHYVYGFGLQEKWGGVFLPGMGRVAPRDHIGRLTRRYASGYRPTILSGARGSSLFTSSTAPAIGKRNPVSRC